MAVTTSAYLTAYVLALLDHGEIINAELYLDRLAAIASDQVSTVILRARMAIAKNDPNTAFDLLKGFVDKPGAKPADSNGAFTWPPRTSRKSRSTQQAGGETGARAFCAAGGNVLSRQRGKKRRPPAGTGVVPGPPRANR